MDSTRIFNGVIADAANNAGDLLTTDNITSDFAHAVLEAFAQNYRHGDAAAAQAAAAVIQQFLNDEAFEREYAIRNGSDDAHQRDVYTGRMSLGSAYNGGL